MQDKKNVGKKVKPQHRKQAHKIRFPSDSLTPKQLAALNGPVIIIRPAKQLSSG